VRSGNGSGSNFFSNKGEVAGVFVVVGLLAASIAIWAVFLAHRRRQKHQLENEATFSGALAAAGYARDGWGGDEEPPEMGQRSRTTSIGLTSQRDPFGTPTPGATTPGSPRGFDPYHDYLEAHDTSAAAPVFSPDSSGLAATPSAAEHPAQTTSKADYLNHRPNQRGNGSYEPLLTAAGIQLTANNDHAQQPSPPSSPTSVRGNRGPTPPPRDPRRTLSPPPSAKLAADRADERLNSRLLSGQDPRDDTDYSRRIL